MATWLLIHKNHTKPKIYDECKSSYDQSLITPSTKFCFPEVFRDESDESSRIISDRNLTKYTFCMELTKYRPQCSSSSLVYNVVKTAKTAHASGVHRDLHLLSSQVYTYVKFVLATNVGLKYVNVMYSVCIRA